LTSGDVTGDVTWAAVPGLVAVEGDRGETTLVVDPARLVDACVHLRDEEGFNFLSDIAAADYLGWGHAGVSGYIGTAAGRDLNRPMTQGYQVPGSRSATTSSRCPTHPGASGCRSGSKTASRCRR
jgi:hypothetical protein